MNYAQQEAPKRRTAGLAFVIVLHIGIVYLLLTGLASKVVEVIRQPIRSWFMSSRISSLLRTLRSKRGLRLF